MIEELKAAKIKDDADFLLAKTHREEVDRMIAARPRAPGEFITIGNTCYYVGERVLHAIQEALKESGVESISSEKR